MANQVVTIHKEHTGEQVATISLNGYNIAEGGTFGRSGAMRSFRLVDGNVAEFWEGQTALSVQGDSGQYGRLRIFALPVERDSLGFVEFL